MYLHFEFIVRCTIVQITSCKSISWYPFSYFCRTLDESSAFAKVLIRWLDGVDRSFFDVIYAFSEKVGDELFNFLSDPSPLILCISLRG